MRSRLDGGARRIVLREHQASSPIRLSMVERDSILEFHPGIQMQPSGRGSDRYTLKPDQHIGVICLPELVLEIQPKIPMPSALYLLSHACEAVGWRRGTPDFSDDVSFTDLVAIMLARLVREATHRGLLHGYRVEVEAAQAPRGRVLFDEFLRRRFANAPPVDIEHDIYTPDILENRILLAALQALRSLSTRSESARRNLTEAQLAFGGVRLLRFASHTLPQELPVTPLNAHYRPALALALLVLRSSYLRLGPGIGRGTAFLVNMNDVFEKFVRNALRHAMGVDRRHFPDHPPKVYLDQGSSVRLEPDLTYLVGGKIAWLGDAKYKVLPDRKHIHADLYQLHAYCTAIGLPEGMLVYGTDGTPGLYKYLTTGLETALHVQELDLNTSQWEIARQIEELARRILASVTNGHHPRTAANDPGIPAGQVVHARGSV